MQKKDVLRELPAAILFAGSFAFGGIYFSHYYRVAGANALIYASLFYIPIVFGGYFYALRGGLGGAVAASLFCGWVARSDLGPANVDFFLQLGSFYVAGVAIGFLRMREAHYRKELDARLRRRLEINDIGKALASSLELQKVLGIMIEKTTEALDCEIGSIMLMEPLSKTLRIAVSHGLDEDIAKKTRIEMGEGISGWVAQRGEAVISRDVEKDKRFPTRQRGIYYTKSFISAPLKIKDRAIGVINVNNKRSREVFTDEDLELLVAIASQVAVALENARLYEHVKEVSITATGALAAAIDARDRYTRQHSENVTRYAVAIAEEMGFTSRMVERIRQAAQLHDVGKIGIPDAILNSPQMLTEKEWEQIKEHPRKGAQILDPLPFFRELVPLVMYHHERYDGRGYPDGKVGDETPVAARVLSVADAYDAMTSTRPYRGAMLPEAAREEMVRGRGTQFDPRIVDAFLRVWEKQSIPEKRPESTSNRDVSQQTASPVAIN